VVTRSLHHTALAIRPRRRHPRVTATRRKLPSATVAYRRRSLSTLQHRVCPRRRIRRLREAEWSTHFNSDAAASEEMKRLNNLLSDYKMEVLVLEGNNRRLTQELTRLSRPLDAFNQLEIAMKSTTSTKSVDWTAHERQLQVDFGRYKAEAEEIRVKYASVEKTRQDQLLQIDTVMKRIATLEADIGLFSAQKKEFDDRYQRAMSENGVLATDLQRAKSELEVERQARARFEAQVQHMASETHEYAMVVKKLKQDVMSFTTSPHTEIIQTDLKAAVEQIRRDYEMKRDELKMQFDVRIHEFQSLWSQENKNTEKLRLEVASMRAHRDRLLIMQKENSGLAGRISTLQRDLEAARRQYASLQEQFSMESTRWSEMKKILESEALLFGSRSKLYGEVVIYRDILEGKAHFEDTHATVQVTQKEKLHSFQDKSSGTNLGLVTLHIVDLDGRYVSLKNVTHSDVNLGGWTIKQWKGHGDAHGSPMYTFQMPNNVVLHAGKAMKIWASGSGGNHAPHDIVASHIHEWCLHNSMTHLYDAHDQNQATYRRWHASEDHEHHIGNGAAHYITAR